MNPPGSALRPSFSNLENAEPNPLISFATTRETSRYGTEKRNVSSKDTKSKNTPGRFSPSIKTPNFPILEIGKCSNSGFASPSLLCVMSLPSSNCSGLEHTIAGDKSRLTAHRRKGAMSDTRSVSEVADCADCGKHWEDRNARQKAAAHSRATSHRTTAEVTLAYSYGPKSAAPSSKRKG